MIFRLIFCLSFSCICSISSAQINCPPNLPLTLVGNTEYCVGTSGSELLVAETYDQYEWLPTTETSQNVLLTAGNYQLVVTHFTGCTDTVDIEVAQVSNPPQPTITASGPTEFCAGESVTLSGPSGFAYYEWSTGSVSEQITLYENITVVLSVEDFIGCTSSSNSLDVIVNPLPEAIVSPDINGYDVEFNNLSVNATSYEWNFGDGTTSTDFEPLHAFSLDGEVDMYLVATNDCGSDTAFLNLTSVSIEENQPFNELSIYPNPTSSGLLNLKLGSDKEEDMRVSLYSITGEQLFVGAEKISHGPNLVQLDLRGLPGGNYLLNLETEKASLMKRVLLLPQ